MNAPGMGRFSDDIAGNVLWCMCLFGGLAYTISIIVRVVQWCLS